MRLFEAVVVRIGLTLSAMSRRAQEFPLVVRYTMHTALRVLSEIGAIQYDDAKRPDLMLSHGGPADFLPAATPCLPEDTGDALRSRSTARLERT